jgi:hypothetical protein
MKYRGYVDVVVDSIIGSDPRRRNYGTGHILAQASRGPRPRSVRFDAKSHEKIPRVQLIDLRTHLVLQVQLP